jgi:HEAT repeat protein
MKPGVKLGGGSEVVVGHLRRALSDRSNDVRGNAAAALGAIGSEKAIDDLLVSLSDMDTFVQWHSAEALGRIGSVKAVSRLIEVVGDDEHDVFVRQSAAVALGRIGSKRAVPHLLKILVVKDYAGSFYGDESNEDVGGDICRSAAGAIASIARKERHVRGNLFKKEVEIAALFIDNHLRRADVPELLNDHDERAWAELLRDKVQDQLSSVLRQPNLLQAEQEKAAGKEGADKKYVSLEKVLDDVNSSSSVTRRRAADTLRTLDSTTLRKAVGNLLQMLSASDKYLTRTAAGLLANMERGCITNGLMDTLTHDDYWVQRKAVDLVGYYSNNPGLLKTLSNLASNDYDVMTSKAERQFAHKLELLGLLVTAGVPQPLGDNESRELFLVGEAFKVTAEAGHIFRPTPNSDWGIDGEIEFKNDRGEATGCRVYLQLKSGDSYLRKRKHDGKEIFNIKKRHAEYWQSHAYPVLLVISDSGGRTRWMNVTEYLQNHGTSSRQIEFQGEPFTVENVKQMPARFGR